MNSQVKSATKSGTDRELIRLRVRMMYAGLGVNDVAAALGVHRTLVSHALKGRRKRALAQIKRYLDNRGQ